MNSQETPVLEANVTATPAPASAPKASKNNMFSKLSNAGKTAIKATVKVSVMALFALVAVAIGAIVALQQFPQGFAAVPDRIEQVTFKADEVANKGWFANLLWRHDSSKVYDIQHTRASNGIGMFKVEVLRADGEKTVLQKDGSWITVEPTSALTAAK